MKRTGLIHVCALLSALADGAAPLAEAADLLVTSYSFDTVMRYTAPAL